MSPAARSAKHLIRPNRQPAEGARGDAHSHLNEPAGPVRGGRDGNKLRGTQLDAGSEAQLAADLAQSRHDVLDVRLER